MNSSSSKIGLYTRLSKTTDAEQSRLFVSEYENLNLCVPATLRALSGAAPPGGQTSLGVDSCKFCYDLPMHGLVLTSFMENPPNLLTQKLKEASQRKALSLSAAMSTEVTAVLQRMRSEMVFVLSLHLYSIREVRGNVSAGTSVRPTD